MSSERHEYPAAPVATARLTRRDFVRRALVIGLSASAPSALLAACGSAPAATATTGPATQATTTAASTARPASSSAAATTSAGAGATPTGGRPNLPSYPAPPAGMYPLTRQKPTFSVLMPANAQVKDFPSNAFTAWYEQRTGVHIDWEVVPSQDARNKLNVTLASGSYPDIIMNFGLGPAEQLLYGAQGIFLPLNDYLDQHGFFTKAFFAAYPQARDVLSAPDGKIYALPQLDDCYHCHMPNKLWIYQPWLARPALTMPTTDEYEQVLQAFKTKDPNGNGQADEIPLMSAVDAQGNQNLDQFLMNAFLFNPGNPWLTLRDGKVTPAYTQPEWRDGLRYLRRLALQGLLAADSFTQKSAQLQQIGNHPDVPILGSVPGIAPSSFMQIDQKRDSRWTKHASVPPLKGPAGVQYGFYDPYQAYSTGSFIITKACKNPALAFQWADGLYELETTLRNIQGIPDQDWRWAKEGELGVNGKPGVFKRLYAFGNVQNDGWAQSGPSYRTQALRLVRADGQAEYDQREFLFNATKESIEPHKQLDDFVLPPLYFNQDQATQLANLEMAITQYVEQQFVAFVTGKADVEKGWDQYVNTLKNQGLPQYLQIYQAAYDARQKH